MPYWNSYVPDFPLSNKVPSALGKMFSKYSPAETPSHPGLYFSSYSDKNTLDLLVRPRLQSYAVSQKPSNQDIVSDEASVGGQSVMRSRLIKTLMR